MKHLKLLLCAAVAVAMAGCSSDDEFIAGEATDGDGNVTLTLNAPEALATRAAVLGPKSSSALGGITNCDMTKYDLRYQLAIYDETGTTQYISPKMKIVDEYQPVTFTIRLTPNHNYKAVAWADFVNEDSQADLHYDTHDFNNITCLDDAAHQLNDESRDAYWISKTISVDDSQVNGELVLRRPFAKVRVVATDWEYERLPHAVDHFKINYKNCQRYNSMDAVSGKCTGAQADNTITYTASFDKEKKDYALSYDTDPNDRTLTVDYLMVNPDEEAIHFNFEALDGTKSIISKDITSDIPIKRNWLTTLIGNFLTKGFDFRVSILEEFEDEWVKADPWWQGSGLHPVEPMKAADGYYQVQTADEFAWFSDHIASDMKIRLLNDIDLNDVPDFKPIGDCGKERITIDGQNHTIRNVKINHKDQNEGVGVFGALYEGSTIKNVNFENITINGLYGSNNHDDETAKSVGCVGFLRGNMENCHATNVEINGAETFRGTGTLPDIRQNIGGLVGYFNCCGNLHITNSSATHVLIHADCQAGGLVGSVGDEWDTVTSGFFGTVQVYTGVVNCLFEGCSVDGIAIHNSGNVTENKRTEAALLGKFLGTVEGGLCALVGEVHHGNGLKFKDCNVGKDWSVWHKDGTLNRTYMDVLDNSPYEYSQKHLCGLVGHDMEKVVVENCTLAQ